MLHFCVICGVLIRRTSFAPGVPPDDDLQWYQQLRVVWRRESSDAATLSGVGYLDSDDRVIAPLGPESSYRDASATFEEYIPYYEGSQLPWSFFFHATCWDILLQRVPEGLSDLSRFSSIFHNVLYCTTWSRHRYVRPGHDFGGSIQFQKPAGDPIRKIIDEGYSYLLGEPLQPRNVAEILRICVGHKYFPVPTRAPIIRSSQGSKDIFSCLPLEVLYMIIELLPSSDIGRLRLASTSTAYVTRPTSLPQRFWRSRFRPDFEMGFAMPIEAAIDEDWRKAYFAIRHALSSPLYSAYLKNRQRMWNIVTANASLLAEHMKGSGLSGNLYNDNNDSGPKLQNGVSDLGRGQIITTQFSTSGHEYLRVGSRKLFDRSIVLPVDEGKVRIIWLSLIRFNSQKFIAGVRFQALDSPTQGCRDYYSLNYISRGSEVKVDIPLSHRIAGFELATRANGVVGMRVVLQKGSNKSWTSWVGDFGDGDPDIAVGMLSLTKGLQRALIVAGFDAFKMLDLAILREAGARLEDVPLQPLWTPVCPRGPLTPALQHSSRGSFNAMLVMEFGGNRGQNLAHLTRIVAHIQEYSAPIVECPFWPSRMEVSSFIDGPAGERMVSITYERASTSCGIVTLQIHTNYGNTAVFMPNELRKWPSTKLCLPTPPNIPSDLSLQRPSTEYSTETLRAPEDQQITGFAANLEFSNHSFQSFHLQYEKLDSSLFLPHGVGRMLDSTPSPTKPAPPPGFDLIYERSNRCMAYTFADLHGVKRILFSKGDDGRPRGSNEISGLWIEYYGSRRLAIIGQWISEGCSLTLEEGERITGVTLLVAKDTMTYRDRYHLGRVVQVSISTSTHTEMYPNDSSLSMDEHNNILRFQESRLEELSSLAWIFNDALFKETNQDDIISSATGFYGLRYPARPE
ncbi:hypothetical protein BDV39DRAFT_217227 [Aspergillus sergii]|uniref:F-box domain-containing protein n=1 Tax=Aspergillus sergii TaxID=1034303 RepID=A0A5N6XIJ6_9EURO|nr:hypothetical protein BDV39DRAFT_217227 [Aspergillus sergii]